MSAGLLAAVTLLIALPAVAGTPGRETHGAGAPDRGTREAETPETAEALLEAGLVVFVDPQTGELSSEPTREQVEALNESLRSSLNRSTEGLETFDLADGGRGVYLAGRFRAATAAVWRADSTWGLLCVDEREEAAAAVDSPTPVRMWEEK